MYIYIYTLNISHTQKSEDHLQDTVIFSIGEYATLVIYIYILYIYIDLYMHMILFLGFYKSFFPEESAILFHVVAFQSNGQAFFTHFRDVDNSAAKLWKSSDETSEKLSQKMSGSKVPTWSRVKMCYGYLGVSKNNGTPKSSILIGFSIINHPFWGTPIFGNIHLFFSLILCNKQSSY